MKLVSFAKKGNFTRVSIEVYDIDRSAMVIAEATIAVAADGCVAYVERTANAHLLPPPNHYHSWAVILGLCNKKSIRCDFELFECERCGFGDELCNECNKCAKCCNPVICDGCILVDYEGLLRFAREHAKNWIDGEMRIDADYNPLVYKLLEASIEYSFPSAFCKVLELNLLDCIRFISGCRVMRKGNHYIIFND